MLIRVLVHLRPRELQEQLEELLGRLDVVLVGGSSGDDLWQRLGAEGADLLVINQAASAEPLEQVIPLVRSTPDRPEVVVLTDAEDAQERARLQAVGSFATVYRELPPASLEAALAALLKRRGEQRVASLQIDRPAFRLGDFVTHSPRMQDLLAIARRVARSDSSVLLLGETGVGKEWLARALHSEGSRAGGPFIAVNCSALPEGLLESELFGHEKGAFTGALSARRGMFELAHRGTLFLDEIGDMSPHLQVKLLRVLQEPKVLRLGSEREIPIDVRVMAATNRDLEQAMASREFRRDLFYRLSVVTLTLPPLRERREDIEALLETYLTRFRAQLGRQGLTLSGAALAALVGYDWPGNVRELINVMERAVLLAPGETIELRDLPSGVARLEAPAPLEELLPSDGSSVWERPLFEVLGELTRTVERRYLERLLARTRGRVGEAATVAGIDPRTLYNKLREHNLSKEDYRRARR